VSLKGSLGLPVHASWMLGSVCRSCYAQRPRMLRKRSHQAFTDLEAEQPLSPVLHPPHQEMGSGESGSDGDEVMGTGEIPVDAATLHLGCPTL